MSYLEVFFYVEVLMTFKNIFGLTNAVGYILQSEVFRLRHDRKAVQNV
jgi:hypothetical protein